jgi:hypothetical protein
MMPQLTNQYLILMFHSSEAMQEIAKFMAPIHGILQIAIQKRHLPNLRSTPGRRRHFAEKKR